MDQSTTGKFISELRKEKGITQRELAEALGVSDKAISKWETGRGMPDVTYFKKICDFFDITVNELLAGSRISQEDYSKKAEENMIKLAKESQSNKSIVIQIIIGIILIILGFVCAGIFTQGIPGMVRGFAHFIDLPSAILLILFYVGAVLVTGSKGILAIARLLRKISIPVGAIMSLYAFVILMTMLSSPETIGPNLAVAVLTLFYSFIVYFITTIIECRLSPKEN